MKVLPKRQVKHKECNKSNFLKYTRLTETRDLNDIQQSKIKFNRNVANLEFLFGAFRFSICTFRVSKTHFKNI